MATRWDGTDAPRGDAYDARWARLAETGANIHGEADLVEHLARGIGGTRVLDAGCGTGRVGIELRRRGFDVVGVDSDAGMLNTARRNDPDLDWIQADLADLSAHESGSFDVALMAGNVLIFLSPGTESRVVGEVAQRIRPGGLLVSGFSIRPDRPSPQDIDTCARNAGLEPVIRFSTWDRQPFTDGDYVVAVHRQPG